MDVENIFIFSLLFSLLYHVWKSFYGVPIFNFFIVIFRFLGISRGDGNTPGAHTHFSLP